MRPGPSYPYSYRVYMGTHGYTWVYSIYMGIQGIHGYTWVYMGIQYIHGYTGYTWVYRVYRVYMSVGSLLLLYETLGLFGVSVT